MSLLGYPQTYTEKRREPSAVKLNEYQSLEKELLQTSQALQKYYCHLDLKELLQAKTMAPQNCSYFEYLYFKYHLEYNKIGSLQYLRKRLPNNE